MDDNSPPPPGEGDIADRRELFERLTRESARDEAAERSFIEHKIQIARTDPNLTEEERSAAVAELTKRLHDSGDSE